MDLEIIEYGFYSLLIVLLGFGIRKYLKWAKLNNQGLILGINVFWLKLTSNVFIIFGLIAFIAFLFTMYYDMSI
ncbi:MAG: hypothetical protein COW03_05515 [Cytophagales bacterium CG12_big_fil_rev_8_21_14_0_65_40_12]|nr:MAG: hypothetical protein COW03_05515 [Cytophagales bacterium CG12_big_fil_rev_8_21_14_0_65_40_12]PIW03736.1 MAG: hypothetical protein COW40_12925 [Cytophagales bacterium CG17_big_fil_post_rev_8_21_14_2_50_40_13]